MDPPPTIPNDFLHHHHLIIIVITQWPFVYPATSASTILTLHITGISFQHGCGQQGWLQQAFHGSQWQDVGQGKGDEDNFCTFLFSLGQKIALVFRKEKRKIQNVNRITGHDEVCAEEGRQDGWKLPGDICNKYQFRHSQTGNGTIQALASF